MPLLSLKVQWYYYQTYNNKNLGSILHDYGFFFHIKKTIYFFISIILYISLDTVFSLFRNFLNIFFSSVLFCFVFFAEAHRALELLEDYHAKLTRPQDKQLRLAIERVIRIFKSRLFQALLGKFYNFLRINFFVKILVNLN